jgi:hypothetical protein
MDNANMVTKDLGNPARASSQSRNINETHEYEKHFTPQSVIERISQFIKHATRKLDKKYPIFMKQDNGKPLILTIEIILKYNLG